MMGGGIAYGDLPFLDTDCPVLDIGNDQLLCIWMTADV